MNVRAAVLLASLWASTPPEALRDPAVVASHDGVLALTLTAARGRVQVGGRRVTAVVYNGSYVTRTLLVDQGVVVRMRSVNAVSETTICHCTVLATTTVR